MIECGDAIICMGSESATPILRSPISKASSLPNYFTHSFCKTSRITLPGLKWILRRGGTYTSSFVRGFLARGFALVGFTSNTPKLRSSIRILLCYSVSIPHIVSNNESKHNFISVWDKSNFSDVRLMISSLVNVKVFMTISFQCQLHLESSEFVFLGVIIVVYLAFLK